MPLLDIFNRRQHLSAHIIDMIRSRVGASTILKVYSNCYMISISHDLLEYIKVRMIIAHMIGEVSEHNIDNAYTILLIRDYGNEDVYLVSI